MRVILLGLTVTASTVAAQVGLPGYESSEQLSWHGLDASATNAVPQTPALLGQPINSLWLDGTPPADARSQTRPHFYGPALFEYGDLLIYERPEDDCADHPLQIAAP